MNAAELKALVQTVSPRERTRGDMFQVPWNLGGIYSDDPLPHYARSVDPV